MESSFRAAAASFRRSFSSARREGDDDDEYELKWAAIERLDTFDRLRTSLFDHPIDAIDGDGEKREKRATDVTKLGALERRLFIENLIKHIENDNLRLLQKQRERIDRSKSDRKLSFLRGIGNNFHGGFLQSECTIADNRGAIRKPVRGSRLRGSSGEAPTHPMEHCPKCCFGKQILA